MKNMKNYNMKIIKINQNQQKTLKSIISRKKLEKNNKKKESKMKKSKIHIKINFKFKNQFLIIKYRNKSNNKNHNI